MAVANGPVCDMEIDANKAGASECPELARVRGGSC